MSKENFNLTIYPSQVFESNNQLNHLDVNLKKLNTNYERIWIILKLVLKLRFPNLKGFEILKI